MRKLLIGLLLTALTAGAVLSQAENPSAASANTGDLRVINALVGIGSVDVYVNDRLIGAGLLPETATPYLSLPAGQYNVAVYPTGADRLSLPLADILLDLNVAQSKTAVVYQNRFAPPGTGRADAPANLRPPVAQSGSIIVLDDNRSPLTLGRTRLTAVHLAPGTPGRLSVAYPSRASLLHEISLAQPYGDIDVDAGVYALTLVDADSPDLNRLAFIGERVFQSSVHYTLVIVPNIQPDPEAPGRVLRELSPQPRLFIISAPIDPPAEGVQLRLIHAAHNTAVVDVFIDGRLAVPRLSYGQYTEYLGLARYSHLIELRRRDAAPDSPALAAAEFEISEENRSQPHWTLLLLNGGSSQLAALELLQAQQPVGPTPRPGETRRATAFVTPGGPMALVLLPDNMAQTARGEARVRVLHAIDGALEISLFAAGLPPAPGATATPATGPTPTPQPPIRIVDPVVYGAEANENEILAGLYSTLTFITGSSTDLLTLRNQQLLAGMVHTFVLIGQPAGEPAIRALEIRDFGRGLPQERLFLGTVRLAGNVGLANVRRQPSDAAGVADQLPNGAEVEVLGRNFDGTWIKIRYSRPGVSLPQEGWIFGQILRVTRLGDPINVLALPQVN
jgi:hypothetical protein